MSIKRTFLEAGIWIWARISGKWPCHWKANPKIFVLRNNDMGDLLVITPLFEALKKAFPRGTVIAGIGPWNKAILENNPYVDKVITISAPWHNKQTCRGPQNSLKAWCSALRYIFRSPEAEALKHESCDIGIDILGSPQGSLLLLKAGISYRLGVKGYAGGHSACQACVKFSTKRSVGDSALLFAKLLGSNVLGSAKPQLFLTVAEREKAETCWEKDKKRLLIGPGAGLVEKRWPSEYFAKLAGMIAKKSNWDIICVGSKEDLPLGEAIAKATVGTKNLCGQASLRETFALGATADLVLANSSMLMHVGAAFERPTLVLLGHGFENAIEHARLWAQGKQTVVMGRNPRKDTITNPDEAFEALKKNGWV